MHNGEVVVLEFEGPLSKPTVGILHLRKPLKGKIIRGNGIIGAIEEGFGFLYCNKYRQEITLSDDIAPLSLRECLAIVGNKMFHIILVMLGQDFTNSSITRVSEGN